MGAAAGGAGLDEGGVMQYLSADALARMLDMTTEHVRDKLSKTHGFPPACVIGAY